MKFDKFLPYFLPIISILVLAVIAFSKPEITGLAVANDKEIVTSQVRIFLDKNSMLPKDSEVVVILDGKEGKMPLTQFIEKSNGFKELKNGEIKSISFKGEGYMGENVYDVDLEEFKLGLVDKKNEHELIIKVLYNNQVLLENKKIVEGNIK
ncbi:MAG TPA: hypothetical protein VJH20_00970 [Candidatus Nanoarchaeia archaeon]|nr:hypothetical protein [Candidatus Nanoarchaeia archaeon]